MSTAQPPLPSSLPFSSVCRIIWTILFFFYFFLRKDGKKRGEKTGAPPPRLSHPCCRFFGFFFFSSCLSAWRGADLHLWGRAGVVSLSQSLRAHSDALRDRGAARHQTTVYGSCGLQGRGRQLHVASRTGSHAFPRDLRGSHPRDHGGNGEKVENGVAPGEGDAAQRERVGESGERGGGVRVCRGVRREVAEFVCWWCGKTRQSLRQASLLRLYENPCQPEQCVRAGRFHILTNSREIPD